jgi:5'-deoxynucleotidase YfbR-like HD superfamily hydrolase
MPSIEHSSTVRRIVGPTILLYGGTYFDFLDPEGSAFTIEDVAHGLSQTCRFAAQCERFYSVAQHSVYVSRIVPEEDAFAGLMHDAAEAFIGDVSKPLKDILPEYRTIEDRIEAAVFARFGVPYPLPRSVKDADLVMLATEQREVMANRDDWDYTSGRRPLEMHIDMWSPADAKRAFLDRFGELRRKIQETLSRQKLEAHRPRRNLPRSE